MFSFVALVVFGLALVVGGVLLDSRTLQGVGWIFAFCGGVGAAALALRWLFYRGVG